MKQLFALFVVSSVFMTAGCSDAPDRSAGDLAATLPDVYAARVKGLVNDLVETVNQNPGQAAEAGAVLLEELEVYETQPVGEFKEIYAQLLAKCQELIAAGESGSKAKISAALKEMQTLAEKLPEDDA